MTHRGQVACRSCGAPIVFLRTKTGKATPVNADTVLPEDDQLELPRHVSHFSTCPDHAQHRRSR